MREWWATLRDWLPAVVRQRCTTQENWSFDARRRWWYTTKAAVALLVGADEHAGRCWIRHKIGWESEHIEVAYGPLFPTYSMEWGEGGEFEYLAVPYRGFGFWVGRDGWP